MAIRVILSEDILYEKEKASRAERGRMKDEYECCSWAGRRPALSGQIFVDHRTGQSEAVNQKSLSSPVPGRRRHSRWAPV